MKKTLVSTVTAVLLLLVLTSLAFAAPSAAPGPTPFKGDMHGIETNVAAFPTLSVTGEGSGNATHLGSYAVAFTAAVNLPTGESTVTAHLTAANGDELFAEGTGLGIVHGDFSTITEWFIITGGTGRFAGASGSYELHRELNRLSGESSGDFAGTIVMAPGK